MARKKIYIERDGQRYELVFANKRNQGECFMSCAFRKIDGTFHDKPSFCTCNCYLPMWFEKIRILEDCWLVKADDPVTNADHRKQRGRTAPNLAQAKKGKAKA